MHSRASVIIIIRITIISLFYCELLRNGNNNTVLIGTRRAIVTDVVNSFRAELGNAHART